MTNKITVSDDLGGGMFTGFQTTALSVFDTADLNCENYLVETLRSALSDAATDNVTFSVDTDKHSVFQALTADGHLDAVGAGFTMGTHVTITSASYTDNDGSWTLTGSLKFDGSGNLQTSHISTVDVTTGSDHIHMVGGSDLTVSGNELSGHITSGTLSNGDVTVDYRGNWLIDNGVGTISSLHVYDTDGDSVTLTGKFASSDLLNGATTIGDYLTAGNMSGNDAFNVADASHDWHAGAGNDTVTGGAGDDNLFGDTGNDNLSGGALDDTLTGGAGHDTLTGGTGADTFVFDAVAASSVDTVTDFSTAAGDVLDISSLLTGYNPGVSAITDFIQITTKGANSIVSVDANGAVGGAHFVEVAVLQHVTGLTDEAALLAGGHIIA